jgi:hypothetical protein
MSHSFSLHLQQARQQASAGNLVSLRSLAELQRIQGLTSNELLDLSSFLQAFGLLSLATSYLEKFVEIAQSDLRGKINPAGMRSDAGKHALSHQIYVELQEQLPDHPIVRRNALAALEHAPDMTDEERVEQATRWGDWAIWRAAGYRARPAVVPLGSRALRIGYVS